MVRSRSVMIVEDEALIAMDLQAELECHGWDVVGPAGTCERALDLVRTQEFSVALLDINLGSSNSFDIADLLDQKNVPYIFLSGDDGSAMPQRYSGRSILSKPIRYAELLDRLESAL